MITEIKRNQVSEEEFNEAVLKNIKENKDGVTDYPILDFDKRSLWLLCRGVRHTLKHSKVKPAGGEVYEKIKRGFDVTAASLLLAAVAVPLGVIALMIFLEDGGNPIFSQVRLTKNGKPFTMYKLRSMCIDAEEKFKDVQKDNDSDGLAFKSDNDPRITKIGDFIRKTSIDELPQLINVIRGDMSIIGPRPPLPREVVLYTPEQMDRLLVKGGLSCINQTEGRSDNSFNEWVESDIEYIKKRSLFLDAKLIVKTFFAVLRRKGAK